jgi:hypothetical protein
MLNYIIILLLCLFLKYTLYSSRLATLELYWYLVWWKKLHCKVGLTIKGDPFWTFLTVQN